MGNPGGASSVYKYMRTHVGAALVLALFAASGCSGDSDGSRTGSGNSSPIESGRGIADCRGLEVPDQELNTNLDREAGTIEFAYYDAEAGHDQVVTIRYRDPACRQNPETRKLIKNVLSTT